MISKKNYFSIIICFPLFWFFFKTMAMYLLPLETATANFIYAENLASKGIFTYDLFSNLRFDSSDNFLYILALASLIKVCSFFKIILSTYKIGLYFNGFCLYMSIVVLLGIIQSRFFSIHFLLIGLLFMSTQFWAGILGDEIIFQGMLYLFVLRAFWKKRYYFLLVWSVLNIVAQPENILFVLPLIIASFIDINELKEREKPKFIKRRIRRTIINFILPLIAFYSWRFFYFGKIFPNNFPKINLKNESTFFIFNIHSYTNLVNYFQLFLLPFIIGIAFYLFKKRKDLSLKYYAILVGFVVFPVLYNSTFSQTDNLYYKNYYIIYIGLITTTLLFIRNYRSITQTIVTFIFVFFIGFKSAKNLFIESLQTQNNNLYFLANDLAVVPNAKALVYKENYLSWLTDWQTEDITGKHNILINDFYNKQLSIEKIHTEDADLIFIDLKSMQYNIDKKKYDLYKIPTNTLQYQKHSMPENSLEKFFYNYSNVKKIQPNFAYVLLWKFGNNYTEIKNIITKYGAVKTAQL